jgi:ParB family transcriptional regulator, chromosome partitioning protein
VAETVRLIDPNSLHPNPENPRLIFRKEELESLQSSIAEQGILVPLTVYQDGKEYFVLDGERRWRVSLRLGLTSIPVIVQPKPDRMQNLMMMFAIHNARKDWDPLPTALKLQELEAEFRRRQGRTPTESELAGIASLTRGEVRRLKKLLGLPEEYRAELLGELEKPRSQQQITVDHVLEATKGAESLRKRGVVDEETEDSLRRAIIDKFRSRVVTNTVAPRKLARLARAVERGEVPERQASRVVNRLINEPEYTIDDAFSASVEQVDFEHGIEQLVERLLSRLEEHRRRGYEPSEKLHAALRELSTRIHQLRG